MVRSAAVRILAAGILLLQFFSLWPELHVKAEAANTATYIPEKAVDYATNIAAHLRQFQSGNQCARYVSACLISGGIDVNAGKVGALVTALKQIKDSDGNAIEAIKYPKTDKETR